MRLLPLAVLFTACAATPVRRPPSMTNLPDVALQTLDGQPQSLGHALAGRPALVSLWATWCDTCLTETGALGRLSSKASQNGAYVVAIDEGEDASTVRAFVAQKALSYPQLVDERFALADAVGSRRVPATLVVDRLGRIVHRGASLDEAALRALDRAIAAPGPNLPANLH